MANAHEVQPNSEKKQVESTHDGSQHAATQAGDALRGEGWERNQRATPAEVTAGSRALASQQLLDGKFDAQGEAARLSKMVTQGNNPYSIPRGMAELSGDLEALHGLGDTKGYNNLLQNLANATADSNYQLKLGEINPATNTYSNVELRLKGSTDGAPLFTVAQPGDTLWGIAEKYQHDPVVAGFGGIANYVKELAQINQLENPKEMPVGKSIFMANAN